MGARLAMMEESLLDNFRGVFHRDAALQGLGDGAAALEHSDRALSFLALALGNLKVVFGAEMRELQDTFGGVDGAFCFRPELVGGTGHPTRFQRAPKGRGDLIQEDCHGPLRGPCNDRYPLTLPSSPTGGRGK